MTKQVFIYFIYFSSKKNRSNNWILILFILFFFFFIKYLGTNFDELDLLRKPGEVETVAVHEPYGLQLNLTDYEAKLFSLYQVFFLFFPYLFIYLFIYYLKKRTISKNGEFKEIFEQLKLIWEQFKQLLMWKECQKLLLINLILHQELFKN